MLPKPAPPSRFARHLPVPERIFNHPASLQLAFLRLPFASPSSYAALLHSIAQTGHVITVTPPSPPPRLILASASPRRLDLLARIGVVPHVVDPADSDESPRKDELPLVYAKRMAAEKAAIVALRHAGSCVLAADTVVAVGRRILPKAETEDQARACLSLISGRRHRVHSAVTLIDGHGKARHRVSTTIVIFKRLSAREIDAYIASGDWLGKAGGYAIQGRAEAFVRSLMGSHSGVIGLPLFETQALLNASGIPHA